MTKDEYLRAKYEEFLQEAFGCTMESLVHQASSFDFSVRRSFVAGFNAACEYYRNNVLELNAEDNELRCND